MIAIFVELFEFGTAGLLLTVAALQFKKTSKQGFYPLRVVESQRFNVWTRVEATSKEST
jgi:hypothetical protein